MINKFSGDYAFLSNFYPCYLRFGGLHWPSVEHAFQAAKTTDLGKREHIRRMKMARDAKRAGRELELREDWEQIKYVVMRTLLQNKFEAPELRKLLLDTDAEELQEGNTYGDRVWGVDLLTGKGQNHLGRLLMEVRLGIQITEGIKP